MNENTVKTPVWGLWGTTLWTLLIVCVFFIVQLAVMLLLIDLPEGATEEDWATAFANVESDGRILAWATISTFLICTPLVMLIANLKSGSSVRAYLALKGTSWKVAGLSILAVLALGLAIDVVNHLLGRPIVPEFMKNIYQSSGSIWLLAIAVVIAAPIFEEVFIRGFLISGLKETFLGGVGAVIVSSLLFASAHLQYDYINLGFIFLVGLLFGFLRLATGSLYLVIFLHMIVNMLSLLQTKVFLEML